MRARSGLLAAAVLMAAGCGYVGEPLPPLLHIPAPVADLSAVERGDRILVQFTVSRLSTEQTVLRQEPELDLRMGSSPTPWNADAWAGKAERQTDGNVEKGIARYQIPVDGWAGKDVVIAVRAVGANGRDAGWSNLVTMAVVAPLAPPAGLEIGSVPEGVRLAWRGSAPAYRIYRRVPGDKSFAAAGETEGPAWTDTHTEYGKRYEYEVRAIRKTGVGEAESELSGVVAITPVDTFPPRPPAGLTAVAATGSVELVWDRSTEPDFAAYRVYRSEGGGAPARIADTGVNPSYSDHALEAGKTYRYAVSAVDAAGNESPTCPPVEVAAP